MKKITFNIDPYHPIVEADVVNYIATIGERKGGAPVRHYMNHYTKESGYTRIRQTKTLIIVEWME